MVKINKIYTRSGDDGTTGLTGGSRVKKSSLRVCCYGELDELNSLLGWARTLAIEESKQDVADKLALLQNEIFDLGAYLSSPAEQSTSLPLALNNEHISRLELWIDEHCKDLPELRSFVLPGGSQLNSVLHVCRSVCRRVERSAIELKEKEVVAADAIKYLNRLSDYLFAASRHVLHIDNVQEFLWQPAKQLKKL